ncbi:MAG: hypothetical protein ACLTTU_09565 [Bilophila wadsworthia]
MKIRGKNPLEASHIMAVPFEKAPDEAEYVTITFEHGDPVAVNGSPVARPDHGEAERTWPQARHRPRGHGREPL